jgi:undecaprenyl diphosphate synthase
LFAFSTQNWGRPEEEVGGLMGLFVQYLEGEVELLLKNQIRLRSMGDKERLSKGVREVLERCEERTKHLDGMELILAISYGGRDELVRAVRKLGAEVQKGTRDPQAI